MNRKEFSSKYCETVERTTELSKKLKEEGLYGFRYDLDREKVNNRDIFEYGLDLVSDGYEMAYIDKVLSNILEQEKDECVRTLKRIQKEAVLMIQGEVRPRYIRPLLNSYTDFKLDEPFDKPSKKSPDGHSDDLSL